jgi:hypothetical protein
MIRERVSLVSSDVRSTDVMKLIDEDYRNSTSDYDYSVWRDRLSRKSDIKSDNIRESLIAKELNARSTSFDEKAKEALDMYFFILFYSLFNYKYPINEIFQVSQKEILE